MECEFIRKELLAVKGDLNKTLYVTGEIGKYLYASVTQLLAVYKLISLSGYKLAPKYFPGIILDEGFMTSKIEKILQEYELAIWSLETMGYFHEAHKFPNEFYSLIEFSDKVYRIVQFNKAVDVYLEREKCSLDW